jgi:uncharacterized protein YkwD
MRLAMLVWLFVQVLTVSPAQAQTRKTPDLAEATRMLVERSNELRRAERAGATRPDEQLVAAARSFASFMARTDRYGHEADGKTPADRAQQHGYRHCIVLENIAALSHTAGFGTQELAERVLQGWQASPGHRKNLLDRDVTDIGIAIAHSSATDKYYAVQMFGRPQSMRIKFHLVNESPAAIGYQLDDKRYALPPGTTRTHERCRTASVTVQWPNGQPATTFEPTHGARYEVERADATYRLKRG